MTFPENPHEHKSEDIPGHSLEIVDQPTQVPSPIDQARTDLPSLQGSEPLSEYMQGFEHGVGIAAMLARCHQRNVELFQENEELRADRDNWMLSATTDDLTGLPNRRAIMPILEEQATEHPGSFGLGFLDFNGLKIVNDTEGHEAGNRLLQRGAEVILSSLRSEDTQASSPEEARPADVPGKMAARLSGDEFAIVLPGVDTEEGIQAVQGRILDRLQEAGIGASFGVAIHQPDQSASELLSTVDGLMYQQKTELRRQRQLEARDALPGEVRVVTEELVEKLGEVGLTVQDLHRLYGDTSR